MDNHQLWLDALSDFGRAFPEKLATRLASLEFKIDSLIDIEKAKTLQDMLDSKPPVAPNANAR